MEKLKKLLEDKNHWVSVYDYINLIETNLKANPNLALDSSKSVLESVAITILKDNQIEYRLSDSLQTKVKKAFNSLKVIQELSTSDNVAGASIVGAFANIATQIGSFRNAHGFISHGRDLQMKKFNQYLLDLSVDSSELLTCFLIKTHDSIHEGRDRIYYDNFNKFNNFLNETTEEYPTFLGIEMDPSKFLFEDIQAYKEKHLEFIEEKNSIIKKLCYEEELELYDVIEKVPYFEIEEIEEIGEYLYQNNNEKYKELVENILNELDELDELSETQKIIQYCLKVEYIIE